MSHSIMGGLLLSSPELKLSINRIQIKQIYIMNNLKNYAKYLLNKCNGDVEFAKKITFNNALLAADKDDLDRIDSEAEIFHHLKVISKKKAS